MKPKTSPTSPKAKTEQTDQIEELYKESLNTIEKPGTKVRFSLGWVVFVVFIGFVAGIIGQLVLISFGDQIPYFEKLGYSSSTDSASLVLTARNKDRVLTAEQVESIASDLAPTVIQLFEARDTTVSGLASQYLPSEAVAHGLALTNDGYAVFRGDVVADEVTYVGVSFDGSVYAVNNLVRDPVTGYVFIQFDARDFVSVGFSDISQIHETEEIIALVPGVTPQRPIILKAAIASNQYRQVRSSADYVFSSERYPYVLLLEMYDEDVWDGAVAYTLDKKAVGILKRVDGQHVIVPFSQLDPILEPVLGNREMERPRLGVEYVLLDIVQPSVIGESVVPASGGYLYEDGAMSPIITDSPAARAGVQAADTITEVDGQSISATRTLSEMVLGHDVGDTITLTIIREGESQKINVTLDSQ